jgi:hypothetical protein
MIHVNIKQQYYIVIWNILILQYSLTAYIKKNVFLNY